uniref:Macaca fascicularis brain cDNA, clone: QflA-22919 n=1 Tax=Macaca fascicularis TaxID=9541 RepID=I7GDL5_MACFA|nr:unnamed protein product [Macaca fascicularis]
MYRSARSDFSTFMSLVSSRFCFSSCAHFPSCNQEYRMHSVRSAGGRGFILVHLNIHDSLHFGSKRHLFI